MTETAKRLLDIEILRRTALAAHGWLENAELVALADEVFRELDHAEEPR
jgi:hypothetical protein